MTAEQREALGGAWARCDGLLREGHRRMVDAGVDQVALRRVEVSARDKRSARYQAAWQETLARQHEGRRDKAQALRCWAEAVVEAIGPEASLIWLQSGCEVNGVCFTFGATETETEVTHGHDA